MHSCIILGDTDISKSGNLGDTGISKNRGPPGAPPAGPSGGCVLQRFCVFLKIGTAVTWGGGGGGYMCVICVICIILRLGTTTSKA